MWTRGELKERGKAALHRNYWIVVLATLVVTALTGGFSNTAGNGSLQDGSNAVAGNGDASATLMQMFFSLFGVTGDMIYKKLIGPVYAGMYASFLLILIMIVISAGLLFRIFVGNLFEVGGCRFYEENSEHKTRIAWIIDGFRNGAYLRNVVTIFLRDLYTLLWMLCLIIPGIVKSYEYKMIPYILAENPQISRKRAFELSKQMMDGQKGDAFVLDLSFIGWEFLSFITLGIVQIFYVGPYINVTWAEFYKVMRENALESGIATREELPGLQKEIDE